MCCLSSIAPALSSLSPPATSKCGTSGIQPSAFVHSRELHFPSILTVWRLYEHLKLSKRHSFLFNPWLLLFLSKMVLFSSGPLVRCHRVIAVLIWGVELWLSLLVRIKSTRLHWILLERSYMLQQATRSGCGIWGGMKQTSWFCIPIDHQICPLQLALRALY